jgi:hypothetical protein
VGEAENPNLLVGQEVDCRHGGGGQAYKGRIASVEPGGVYGVDYDDGDHENSVSREMIFALNVSKELAAAAASARTVAAAAPSSPMRGNVMTFDALSTVESDADAVAAAAAAAAAAGGGASFGSSRGNVMTFDDLAAVESDAMVAGNDSDVGDHDYDGFGASKTSEQEGSDGASVSASDDGSDDDGSDGSSEEASGEFDMSSEDDFDAFMEEEDST